MSNENISVATINIPPPVVKTPRISKHRGISPEFRVGRGYSIGELKEAGLTLNIAKQLNIPIDIRRRSTHKINVENLKKIVNELSELINAKKTKPAKMIIKQKASEST